MFSKVLLNRPLGWYGVVLAFLMPARSQSSLIVLGPVYTRTLAGENDKIFYRKCLSFRR